jgi:hypothetical protein
MFNYFQRVRGKKFRKDIEADQNAYRKQQMTIYRE